MFPLVSACVHPPSQDINNSTVQFIFSVKHAAFEESHPSRCVLKPPSFLFSRCFHFECCNQLCVSSLKPVRLPRQFCLIQLLLFCGASLQGGNRWEQTHTGVHRLHYSSAKLSTADQMLLFCCLCEHRIAAGGVGGVAQELSCEHTAVNTVGVIIVSKDNQNSFL